MANIARMTDALLREQELAPVRFLGFLNRKCQIVVMLGITVALLTPLGGELVAQVSNTSGQQKISISLEHAGTLPNNPFPLPRVTFANIKEGWEYGIGLWRTDDGGVHWKPVNLPSESKDYFEVQLTATRRGWLRIDQKLFRTDDIGLTWRPQELPRETAETRLENWLFLGDGAHGWIILQRAAKSDRRDDAPGVIDVDELVFRTIDGGHSWISQRSAPHRKSSVETPGRLYFHDALHGFWFDQSLYVTSDGGQTWQTMKPAGHCGGGAAWPLEGDVQNVRLFDERLGWAVNNNTLLRTESGGASWCELPAPEQIWHNPPGPCPACVSATLAFWTAQRGLLIRWPFGNTFLTDDGGTHWNQVLKEREPISAFCLDGSPCWIVTSDRQLFRVVTK
jgi:photosystem II stability/assembly factor-like uncharacterized protein